MSHFLSLLSHEKSKGIWKFRGNRKSVSKKQKQLIYLIKVIEFNYGMSYKAPPYIYLYHIYVYNTYNYIYHTFSFNIASLKTLVKKKILYYFIYFNNCFIKNFKKNQ